MDVERYSGVMRVILASGSCVLGEFDAAEVPMGREVNYRVILRYQNIDYLGESEKNFFDALRNLRMRMESEGMLLCCFGASENVYPSPMQQGMGPASSAYKMYLGKQAQSKDIVNIFDYDDTVKPVSVKEQMNFRDLWFKSLRQEL